MRNSRTVPLVLICVYLSCSCSSRAIPRLQARRHTKLTYNHLQSAHYVSLSRAPLLLNATHAHPAGWVPQNVWAGVDRCSQQAHTLKLTVREGPWHGCAIFFWGSD